VVRIQMLRRSALVAVLLSTTCIPTLGVREAAADSARSVPSAARAEAQALLQVRASGTDAGSGGSNWQWFAPPLASVTTVRTGPISIEWTGKNQLMATAPRETLRVAGGVAGTSASIGVQRVIGSAGATLEASVSVVIGETGDHWQQTGDLTVKGISENASRSEAVRAATGAVKHLLSYHGSVASYNAEQSQLYVTKQAASNIFGSGYAPPSIHRFSARDDGSPGPPLKVVGYSLPSSGTPNAAPSSDSLGTLLSPACGAGEVPTYMSASHLDFNRTELITTAVPTYLFEGSATVITGPWSGYVEGPDDYSMTARHCAGSSTQVKFQIAVVDTPLHGWLVDYLALPGLVQSDSPGDYRGQIYQVCQRPGDTVDVPTC
jgi:hypothetical protein